MITRKEFASIFKMMQKKDRQFMEMAKAMEVCTGGSIGYDLTDEYESVIITLLANQFDTCEDLFYWFMFENEYGDKKLSVDDDCPFTINSPEDLYDYLTQ